jgi:hypothetical protein
MPTPGLSISYDIGRGRLPVDTGRARRQRRETFANPVAPRRAAPGRAHRVRLILRLPGLTELRLSVPETGKRLLPLPVAVWHKTVGKATDSICPKSAAEHPLKLRDQAKADEVVGVILNVHEQFGKPSGLGLTIAGRSEPHGRLHFASGRRGEPSRGTLHRVPEIPRRPRSRLGGQLMRGSEETPWGAGHLLTPKAHAASPRPKRLSASVRPCASRLAASRSERFCASSRSSSFSNRSR